MGLSFCYLQFKMEAFYNIPFHILEIPNLKVRKLGWIKPPSAMVVFSIVLLSYFLVTGGIIYDVIVEPPSVGSTTDESGHSKPVAFMPYRVNGQNIMEGLASSFLFAVGGLGYVILEKANGQGLPRLNRFLLLFFGFLCVIVPFFTPRVFMRMKLPGYMS